MTPDFNDPNNHVPEVKPGDDWGDAGPEAEAPVPLPPKKKAAKKSAGRKKAAASDELKLELRELKPDDVEAPVDLPAKPKKKGSAAKKKAAFEDPNNHVPEVKPEDDWGDEKPQILPRKRQADEKPAGYSAQVTDDGRGIEIGVKVIGKSDPTEPKANVQRLEVQEHVPKLLAPENAPLPKIVPKNVMEKVEPSADNPAENWPARGADAEKWGTTQAGSMRWMVISVAAIAVFVLGGVLILPHVGWKGEKSVQLNYSNLEMSDEGPKVNADDGLSLSDGIEDKAKVIVEKFVTAKTVEEILPLVRDGERLEPILRKRWKPQDVAAGWKIPDSSEWSIRKAGKRDFGYLAGMYPDITPFRFYIVQKGENALIDWEASVAYSETTFEDLSKRNGDGGVTRCVLSPGDLYTFSMPETDYQCFRLGDPAGDYSIWGYVKRDDPMLEQLTNLFVQGAIPREIFSEYPITLRLEKGPEDSLPNQWLIKEKLYLDWISE